MVLFSNEKTETKKTFTFSLSVTQAKTNTVNPKQTNSFQQQPNPKKFIRPTLTLGNAPDTAQMNAKVREMIKEALQSDGVEEIFKLGDEAETEQDIFEQAENFKRNRP